MSALAKRWLRLCWVMIRMVFWLVLLLHMSRLWSGLQPVWLGQLITMLTTAAAALLFADAVRDAAHAAASQGGAEMIKAVSTESMLALQALGDIRAEDLREFAVWWKGDSLHHDKYVIHKDHVDAMRDAFVALHHSPGVNPHNGERTAEIWKLECGPLLANGPFWWTTPDLAATPLEVVGALLLTGYGRRAVWKHPELEAEERLAD